MLNNNNNNIYKIDNKYNISIDYINKFNIIINNEHCGHAFFNKIIEKLKKDGFKIIETLNCNFSPKKNDIVITLDQQYVSGPYISIFCPFYNGGKNNSDALAIALENSFNNNNINSNGIFSGKKGYIKNINGTINSRIPTNQELKLFKSMVNYVTISFGTNSLLIENIVNSIEEGIARFIIYLTEKIDNDLIYRVENIENLDFIANKFNVSKEDIKLLNSVNNKLIKDITIINPIIYNSKILNNKININIIYN